MDDLEDLQARVAAAQEKLRLNADAQRKYGLRLNDVVTIVEGSLARQQDEMKRLQDAAVALRLERDALRVSETQIKSLYEAALTRLNLLQTQNEQLRNMVMTLLNVIEGRESASALQTVLQRLESSVHEIAAAPALPREASVAPAADLTDHHHAAASAELAEEVVETEESPSIEIDVPAAEEPVADSEEMAVPHAEPATTEPAGMVAAEAETADVGDETAPTSEDAPQDESAVVEAVGEAEFEELDEDDEIQEGGAASSVIDPSALTVHDAEIETVENGEAAGTEMLDAVAEDVEADDSSESAEDMPEDIAEMSMNGHRDIVTDADEMLANETVASASGNGAEVSEITASAEKPAGGNGPQDETLVTALLDAEKALIEAGASGVANANSPVAEIIRRISLRTREFSEASGV